MIDKISLYQLKMPLKEPYHLSFVELHHFDTFIAVVQSGGRTGIGETTPLPGYCDEDAEQVWAVAREVTPRLLGDGDAEAREILEPYIKKNPFAATLFLTALEMAAEEKGLAPVDVELVGILSTGDHAEIARKLPEAVSRGFKTIKVKVGKDVEADIAKVNYIQSIRPGGVVIRIDANQGYDYDQAARFVRGVRPEGIELFEQPFPKGVWDEMKKLSEISPIPLMLDESINTEEDLMRTIELKCASYVKFKLMKAGSLTNLSRLINTAREAGLKVVLGNGVAGEIGCYHEAVAATRVGLENAGEMNGFLKLTESVLVSPLRYENGRMKVDRGFEPRLDPERLTKYLVRELVWER
jgi:o-succinylbenzoate synthase